MALITISGFPSSGKSTRAKQIQQWIQHKIQQNDYNGPIKNVEIISDHSLQIQSQVYSSSATEKPARGTLFAAVQRQMAPHTALILDSLNYIKGFRYQLYCAAREFKLRTCTIHVLSSPESCREWNAARVPEESYPQETLENLFQRFEEPSSMVRWDAPLFTLLPTDVDLPTEIWDAITSNVIKPPNAGTLSTAKAPADALHVLEQTTASIVSALASNASLGGATCIVEFGSNIRRQVKLPARSVTLAELQRLKRQFITVHKKAITLGTTERGSVDWSEERIGDKFIVYLEEHVI
ncbi:chromatin associated protein KTI12 [Panaeolus papilionaceus]|nr:chromatin associated protein KTI12 [Panaeolus papilionaceus]